MREQIQQFLDYITEEKGYSQNTLAAYRNDLSQFAEFLEGRVADWDQVTRDSIVDYIMTMKAEQEYASSTVARKVAAIKSFFHYLVERGKLQDDPTATLDSPKVRKRLPKAISSDDMERLLSEPAVSYCAGGSPERQSGADCAHAPARYRASPRVSGARQDTAFERSGGKGTVLEPSRAPLDAPGPVADC
jgi:integrase